MAAMGPLADGSTFMWCQSGCNKLDVRPAAHYHLVLKPVQLEGVGRVTMTGIRRCARYIRYHFLPKEYHVRRNQLTAIYLPANKKNVKALYYTYFLTTRICPSPTSANDPRSRTPV